LISMLTEPQIPISKLNIVNVEERTRLLIEFNNTQADYPHDQCFHQLFEIQAELVPANIAVTSNGYLLSFSELNQRANRLAHYLNRLGVRPEARVGIYLERSCEMLVALLGILKAGAAYLPLDLECPTQRLNFILSDAQADLVLTKERWLPLLPKYAARYICLDSIESLLGQESESNPAYVMTPANLAYVIYTSGSTGKPKGVMISHNALVNYLSWCIENYKVAQGKGTPIHSTISFDLTITSLLAPLLVGRQVLLIPEEFGLEGLSSCLLKEKGFSLIKITPAHLEWLNQLLPKEDLQGITERVIVGGEALWSNSLSLWRDYAPQTKIINEYGPTETTVGCCVYEVEDSTIGAVPIGRPISNTQIYILDRHLNLVPTGVAGELYIGGVGLARGYLNRPELTAERFIPHPFSYKPGARLYRSGDLARYLSNGNLEYLGRIDQQVKIRGFRVELSEIELVLTEHRAIQQAAVIVRQDTMGDKQLIAYLVPDQSDVNFCQDGPARLVSDVQIFLTERLPDYMIPSAFLLLEKMPLTSNGKVDRQALLMRADISVAIVPFVAARTNTEQLLANIWSELLGGKRVGINDDFFKLGGHSLLVARLIFRIRETFRVKLAIHSLFQSPTLAELAHTIDEALVVQVSEDAVPLENPDLIQEAVLDPTIRVSTTAMGGVAKLSHILLTGATGFVGTFLLSALLEHTDAKIYCLVRACDVEDGTRKIQEKLKSLLLWHDSLKSRIIVVVGDLSQPLLGLSPEQFARLAEEIDAIYHNGAFVNFIYPYQILKPTNVLGTQEILRLASQSRIKPVHYISTLGVFDISRAGKDLLEDDNLDSGVNLTGGYLQSKWVAERLIGLARSRGIPCSIYRLGRVTGDSRTGVSNTNDILFRMIKGCIQLGSAPMLNYSEDITPVDYICRAIVHLSKQPSEQGKNFHLVNPQRIKWNDLVKWIEQYGYTIKLISYDEWITKLIAANQGLKENALLPLISIFTEQTPGKGKQGSLPGRVISSLALRALQLLGWKTPFEPRYNCRNTQQGLVGASIACPQLNNDLLMRYFSYFIRNGFLDAPT
ncbi:MAG: amino acid adenylation domain-containing protein, partial [Acidobacteriota bacterium]